MSSLIQFIEEVNAKLGIALPAQWQTLTEIEIAQRFLQGVNRYFFQTRQGIGTTNFQGEELQYFSDFHKYWEANHRLILDARIDREQARIAARTGAGRSQVWSGDLEGDAPDLRLARSGRRAGALLHRQSRLP